jgi:hypothetical protein
LNMPLACFSANSDRPPTGFCNELLLGSKYDGVSVSELALEKHGSFPYKVTEHS